MSKATPHFNTMIAARGGAGQSAAACYDNSTGIDSTPNFNRQTAGNPRKPAPPPPKARK